MRKRNNLLTGGGRGKKVGEEPIESDDRKKDCSSINYSILAGFI
jgi:hypothetical protein